MEIRNALFTTNGPSGAKNEKGISYYLVDPETRQAVNKKVYPTLETVKHAAVEYSETILQEAEQWKSREAIKNLKHYQELQRLMEVEEKEIQEYELDISS